MRPVHQKPGISRLDSAAVQKLYNCSSESTINYLDAELNESQAKAVRALLHDRMSQAVLGELQAAKVLFAEETPRPLTTVDVLDGGLAALQKADAEGIATPANWQPGDKVVVPAPKTAADMEKRPTEGYECKDWYLCYKKI